MKGYLHKHQLFPLQIDTPPDPDLSIVVVIPCHDEAGLLATLESLWACERAQCAVEVIVVINASAAHPAEVHQRNHATLMTLGVWIAGHLDTRLQIHAIYHPGLPAKQAGVGFARKLGMDEAFARLSGVGNEEGVIVGFDADCRCAGDYLISIERHFDANPVSPGCSIHFEHPLSGDPDPRIDNGIAHYELYLRYYLLGLRYARFPHAFHTVGSSMAVRAWAYANQGGMNRRQAGEDFYFLNKIIPLGGFSELRDTTVVPSARCSHRVPFGTGRAMTEWLAGSKRYEYVFAARSFQELGQLFNQMPDWFDDQRSTDLLVDTLPPGIASYLLEQRFGAKIEEIRANVSRRETFIARFFRWFDAFRVFKFLRWNDTERSACEPLTEAVVKLLEWCAALPVPPTNEVVALLHHLRKIDREGRFGPTSPGL